MGAIGVVDEAEQSTKALEELFDRCGGNPENIRVLLSEIGCVRPCIGQL
jgi:hypothetical protein